MRKIKPYGPIYYQRLADLIIAGPCMNCGSPVVRGYICSYCDHDPTDDYPSNPAYKVDKPKG